MSNVCPKCGKKVDEGDSFCLSCGAKLASAESKNSVAGDVMSKQDMTMHVHTINTIRGMIRFCTGAYVVIGAILGYIIVSMIVGRNNGYGNSSASITMWPPIGAIVGGSIGYLVVTAKMMVVKLLLIISENTQQP